MDRGIDARSAVAALARSAIRSSDLGPLVEEACACVARVLGTEPSAVRVRTGNVRPVIEVSEPARSADDVDFLQSVGDVLALAIERDEVERRARAQAEAALERLRAIHTITDAALSNLSLDDLLRELLARLRSTLQAEVASVRLVDEERGELYARAIDGVQLGRVAGVRIPLSAVDLSAPALFNEVKPPDEGRGDWYAEAWTAL